MRIQYISTLFLILVALVCLPVNFLFADAASQELEAKSAEKPRVQAQKQPTLDPRMPAVVPGEELVRNGKKIKVWSTSGSPSVAAEVPNSPSPAQNWTVEDGRVQGVPIIVDGRGLLPNNHRP